MVLKKYRAAFYIFLFLSGGGIYVVIELLFRGHSHIGMLYAGGISVVLLSLIDNVLQKMKIIYKILLGGAVITLVELAFGALFNLRLGLEIWDYSGRFLNLYGQICPLFSFFWTLLSFPAILLSRYVGRFFSALEKLT